MTRKMLRGSPCLVLAVLAACGGTPALEDASFAPDDASAPRDDAALGEDAARATCTALTPGRWSIRAFTYAGPDCVPEWTVDSEYHVIAFTVGASGIPTSCECDTATDACTLYTVGLDPDVGCTFSLVCHGNDRNLSVRGSDTVLAEWELAGRAGICSGTGAFTPD